MKELMLLLWEWTGYYRIRIMSLCSFLWNHPSSNTNMQITLKMVRIGWSGVLLWQTCLYTILCISREHLRQLSLMQQVLYECLPCTCLLLRFLPCLSKCVGSITGAGWILVINLVQHAHFTYRTMFWEPRSLKQRRLRHLTFRLYSQESKIWNIWILVKEWISKNFCNLTWKPSYQSLSAI